MRQTWDFLAYSGDRRVHLKGGDYHHASERRGSVSFKDRRAGMKGRRLRGINDRRAKDRREPQPVVDVIATTNPAPFKAVAIASSAPFRFTNFSHVMPGTVKVNVIPGTVKVTFGETAKPTPEPQEVTVLDGLFYDLLTEHLSPSELDELVDPDVMTVRDNPGLMTAARGWAAELRDRMEDEEDE